MKLAKFFFALSVGLVLSFGSQWAFAQTNFWEPINGPYGGDIRAFAIKSNGHIFVGSNGGGVFRSTDNAGNWLAVNTGLTDLDIRSLAINSDGHIFAGTNGGGVFRSTDNGVSWTAVNTGLTSKVIFALVINASGHIFAGAGGGAFRSENNGDSWTAINTGLGFLNVASLAINPQTQDIFAGTTSGGVYRSTNNGDSWTPVNNGLTNTFINALTINSSGHIFAGTNDGVFRSLDNGGTWAKVLNFDGRAFYSLAINPTTQDIFAGSGHFSLLGDDYGDVFRFTNNDSTWTRVASGLADYVYALAINSEGHVFAGTREDGYRSTDNGNSWTTVMYMNPRPLAINQSTGHIFAGTDGGGVFRTTDNGDSWTAVNNGLTNKGVLTLAVNQSSGHVFAGTSGGGVFRSTNNGDSWTAINVGLGNATVQSLAINPATQDIFAGTSNLGIYRSTNNGDSWTRVSNVAFISALAINSSGHIFAGSNFGASAGVYRSTDNGDSWTPVNNGLTQTTVRCLAVNPTTQDIFAGMSGGAFRSTNNGDSWTTVVNNTVLAFAINASGHIFAGSGGVLRSTNNGDSWTAVNTGLTNTNVLALAINASGHIFVGTVGGVFRSVKSTIVPAPAVPTLASPPDSAVNQPTTLTLSWNPSTGAETYRLQVSTSSDFATIVVDDSTLVITSRVIEPLANDTKYYWRVKAKNIGGTSAWSEIRSFTTVIAAPATPTLVSPANGALSQPTTLTLSWNPATGAATYRLQVSTSSAFATTVVDDSTITTTSQQVGPLANNTTYYWRVNAKNLGGASAWSETRRFTTIVQLPSQVFLLSPSHAAVIQADSVQFTWRRSQPAVNRYWFEIATDSVMTNPVIDSTLMAADTMKVIRQLSNQQTYWWRVRAGNVTGWGPFSAQRRFRVDFPTSVQAREEIPSEFGLSQNYPNPFNPSTTIEYALPQPSHVVLKVYDILGNEVRTLMNEKQPAGAHRVQFDARGLPSGVYFYRIEVAGKFVQTKKLTLIK